MSDEPAEPLTHEEALGLLDSFHDGELDPEEAARVRSHVDQCDRCQRVEAALGGSLRQAMNDGAAQSRSELLPGVQRKLRLRSRGKFYGEEKRRAVSPWPLMLASIGVLVALVVSYLLLGHVGAASGPGVAPTTPIPAPFPSPSASPSGSPIAPAPGSPSASASPSESTN